MSDSRRFIPRSVFSILIIALTLRLVATFFAQGYMAHDDHFETVEIAWSWHQQGMFLEDGSLRWEGKPDIGVMRSAVYNLFLLGLMKLTGLAGVVRLDAHMYFDRFMHALLSLLPIVFGYKYLKDETDERTAIWGALALSCYFVMPYLSVRNLVEMVAADLLLPCLYYANRAMKQDSIRANILAAIFGGLAFAVRPQVALALCIVPFAMGIQCRKWKSAVVFTGAMVAALALQGLFDIYTHGKFMGSVSNYIVGNLGAPPTIPGPWYRYVILLFALFIPPFAIVFLGSMFQKRVIRDHLIMWSATILFVVGHSVIVNKQERFMIPILPVMIVLGCVGLYYWQRSLRPGSIQGRVTRWLLVSAVTINLILLIPFTINYGKRGAIEPLVYLAHQQDAQEVVFDATERRLFIPYSYWDNDRSGAVPLFAPSDLDSALAQGRVSRHDPPTYAVIFTDNNLEQHLQILREKLGEYEPVFHGRPSLIDNLANRLNPKYNRRNESWVVRRSRSSGAN
ncbi:MAG: glycosyltransferase family 39 protein [Candidatus Zixiibacteriota bacterium]